jgi:uncharacterized membrane protein
MSCDSGSGDRVGCLEVNLKSEMELMQLHDKLDLLVQQKWQSLIDAQAQQIEMLDRVLQHLERQGRENGD